MPPVAHTLHLYLSSSIIGIGFGGDTCVFTTCTGGSYYDMENRRAPGFKNIWGRSIKKALALTKLEESFTEHDLRGKVGSDFDTDSRSQSTLGHSDAKTTRKQHCRKGSLVQPAEGFFRDVDSAD